MCLPPQRDFLPLFSPLEKPLASTTFLHLQVPANLTDDKRGHVMKICHDAQLIVAEQPAYMLIQAQTSPSSPALEPFLAHSTARGVQAV